MRRFCCFALLITILVTSVGLVGCDQLVSLVQQDDEHVKMVKEGHPKAYPNKTYGKCFDSFFGTPAWKYFVGTQNGPDDDGDGKPDYTKNNVDVVEFTGYCMYQEVEVKACIQFILDVDEGSFDATYLSFNDVPQNKLLLYSLISKAFEEYTADSAESNQTKENAFQMNSYEDNKDSETIALNTETKVKVPNVVGSDVDSAKQILINKSLIPVVTSEYSEFEDEGNVIRTEPSGGTEVAPESRITIVKSAGSQYNDYWNYDEYYYDEYYYDEEDGYYGSDYGDPPEEELSSFEDDDYIFPDSSKRRLTEEDLMYFQKDVLRIARNEIYARHGRKFSSEDLQEWFNSKSWYYGLYSPDQFDESVLNEYEKYNVNFIKSFE